MRSPQDIRSWAGREQAVCADGDHRSPGIGFGLAAARDAQRAAGASCLWSRGCGQRALRNACVDLTQRPEASPHSDTADGLPAGLRAGSTNAQLQAAAKASRPHGFGCFSSGDSYPGGSESSIRAPAVTTSGLASDFCGVRALSCPAAAPAAPAAPRPEVCRQDSPDRIPSEGAKEGLKEEQQPSQLLNLS